MTTKEKDLLRKVQLLSSGPPYPVFLKKKRSAQEILLDRYQINPLPKTRNCSKMIYLLT